MRTPQTPFLSLSPSFSFPLTHNLGIQTREDGQSWIWFAFTWPKPHSHSTSWRYECHRPMINDTTPAVLSRVHNPDRPTDRPLVDFNTMPSASNEEVFPWSPQQARSRRISRLRSMGISERIEPVPSITHPSLLFPRPIYCSDRSDRPARRHPTKFTSTCEVRDARQRNPLPDALARRTGFIEISDMKVRSEGFIAFIYF